MWWQASRFQVTASFHTILKWMEANGSETPKLWFYSSFAQQKCHDVTFFQVLLFHLTLTLCVLKPPLTPSHYCFPFFSVSSSTYSSPFSILHLTLWMYPVTASNVYKNKLSLWCHWAMWIYIIHLPLSLYLAKAFPRVHHWQVVKPPSKFLYSVQKMALMLLIEMFLSSSFSGWAVDSFLCWPAERQPTKHQEELSC